MTSSDAGSKIGLIINYELILILYFQWCIYHLSETEYQMNSVARILNYSKLKSEAAYESSPDKQPPADWPQKGEIEFKNVSLKYSNDRSIVLNNISFLIKPGEKIGIVGRTGAGKSSIIASLFRMTEPTGIITIDGIDTKNIGLRELRSKISIIPQDPVLFTGTLRRNIDPFNEYSEEMLWQAIEKVQLKDVIKNLPGGIDTHLTEGGRNFCVGERQLICLARTILCQNKILVMDEATSNIDKICKASWFLNKAYPRAICMDTGMHGFESCGLWTCNRFKIGHEEYVVLDEDANLSESAEVSQNLATERRQKQTDTLTCMAQSNQTTEREQTEEVESPQLPEVPTTHPSEKQRDQCLEEKAKECSLGMKVNISNTETVRATFEIISPLHGILGIARRKTYKRILV
ncbi:probable multidrug resistance-associated protein lethal(2)03659 [Centruroides sculpturatus]|uniref:probable multidrug resistance-associated protein lethal(2)03659 n=1 Tax=Centruroides sculpturatus TaxID=218467 RepID=UPI000C6CE5A0|nr:probable multidrug resistance-associated protein lethal(2)03659 [Centruroides sculpturatus]